MPCRLPAAGPTAEEPLQAKTVPRERGRVRWVLHMSLKLDAAQRLVVVPMTRAGTLIALHLAAVDIPEEQRLRWKPPNLGRTDIAEAGPDKGYTKQTCLAYSGREYLLVVAAENTRPVAAVPNNTGRRGR